LLTLAARTYAAGSDFASAERFLRQAIDLDNGYVAAYGALGQLYLAQDRLDSARAEFEALAQRTPTSIAAQTMVGVILQSQGNIDGAREQFERALQIDPDAALAANNLAWIYAEHGGNLDVAMNLAQTAQKRLPGVAEVSDTLGFIYYKKNLPALAISLLNVSAAQDPANAVYQYHLGLAYVSAGDAVRARASLSRALSLKPDFHGAEHAKSLLVATAIR
jgi:tetratricopeptide (TPR) repeat protein